MLVPNLTQYLPAFLGGAIAWVLLGLRLIWGAILISYSLPMVKNPLNWMDREEQSSGFPPLLQAMGAFTIFGGSVAIMVGFLTPLAALGLAGAMGIALTLHLIHGTPFVKAAPDASGESYDNSLLYLAIALLLVFLGSGIFSLDYLLCWNMTLPPSIASICRVDASIASGSGAGRSDAVGSLAGYGDRQPLY